MLFQANLLASTQVTKSNTTKSSRTKRDYANTKIHKKNIARLNKNTKMKPKAKLTNTTARAAHICVHKCAQHNTARIKF